MTARTAAIVGSELIGQAFKSPKYLHSRPSAAGKDGYDATASRRNEPRADERRPRQGDRGGRRRGARENRPGDPRPVPADLVTSVGLGPRPAPLAGRARSGRPRASRRPGASPRNTVAAVIRRHVEPRTLGLLGEPRVNVLLTNLDLDRALPVASL